MTSALKQAAAWLQIHAFRLSVWQEHTNQLSELYQRPQSLECAREMRHLAEKNWQDYVSPEVKDISSHLMNYPILVRAQAPD